MQQRPWWHADTHADRRPLLLARGRIKAALRAWFETQGFLEVETSALQVSPGNEAHLHAFATEMIGPDGSRRSLYLHTSPEFACKKLLAAGEARIFTFAQVYRNRERGALHHPAFTMLEWYRAREPYERLMDDCAAILRIAAETAGTPKLCFGRRSVDPLAPPDRITVAEAFAHHAGIDLLATLCSPGRGEGRQYGVRPYGPPLTGNNVADVGSDPIAPTAPHPRVKPGAGSNPLPTEEWGEATALAEAARSAGIRVAADDAWGDIFSRVLVEKVEPVLGNGRATILCEYPAHLAALARPKPSDPRVAERFELYACGVELANAFGELTDPLLQRERLEAEMAEKQRIWGERYPIDEDFLAALADMPAASGAALGFDRLVMLATGASRIDEVLWTPVVEP